VVGAAQCMLKAKGLPDTFWGEAVATTVYVLNRSMSKGAGGRTPYELWTGSTPVVQHLRTFGCAVLDGVCHRRGRTFVARPCVGLCMGAGVATADHVLVLPDVCARRAYVAKEEGRSSGCSSVCRRRRRAGVCRLASGPFVDLGMEAFVRRGRVAPGEDGVCAPTGVWRPDPKKRRPDHVSILRGGVCAPGDVCRPEKTLLADVEEEYALL
jgi:hypothetical protein